MNLGEDRQEEYQGGLDIACAVGDDVGKLVGTASGEAFLSNRNARSAEVSHTR